jgi:glycosyltransferase involved in cell wall biosynthesis
MRSLPQDTGGTAEVSAIPRLSIGLPVYNSEDYLAESLEALLGQSYEDYELIISDNASTDGTADICRSYAKRDSRIRYFRQPRNIGAAPNHNFVFEQSRSELFKWASGDDLYAHDLLERCIAALDEHPDVALAHSWTAAIDGAGKVTQALPYHLQTESPDAPVRFHSMLFGAGENDYGIIRADDEYGVIRSQVMRRINMQGSFYNADRVFTTGVALYGRFYLIPEWLYFRRDHDDRAAHAQPTVRKWCTNLDPRRASRLRHPTARLVAEYIWGYIAAIQRAPLSSADRLECYGILARWGGGRALPAINRAMRLGNLRAGEPVPVPPPDASLSVDAVVAGRRAVNS